MDLHAAHLMRTQQSALSRMSSLFCFSLACALMVGSLVSPGAADPKLHDAAKTAISSSPAP